MWCASKRKREFTCAEEADFVERRFSHLFSFVYHRSFTVRCVSDQCHLVMRVKIGFGIVSLGNINQVYSRVACVRICVTKYPTTFFLRESFSTSLSYEFILFLIRCETFWSFLREEFWETKNFTFLTFYFACLGNFVLYSSVFRVRWSFIRLFSCLVLLFITALVVVSTNRIHFAGSTTY